MLSRAVHALEHHPKHVTALVAALLLGGGGGAFAVASFGPDAATLPVQEVLEAVEPLPLHTQSEALDLHSLRLFRSDLTRANDTVESLLARMGVSDYAAAMYLRNDPNFRAQALGRTGRMVSIEATEGHTLDRLTVRWTPEDDGQFRRLVVERQPQGFDSHIESAPLAASARLGSGSIRTTLFQATDDARVPDAVAIQMAEIFSGDIDFHRALRKGDRFNVVYETLEADGEPMRAGRVLSAEFANNGRTFQAVWFQEPGQKGGYYTLDGKSLQSSYLASPMEFSRVTSSFSMRFHPILQSWRAHLGTDYGAATGTPVRSVGDGVVEFAGVQNGYGNVIMVRHNKSDVTVYAHLSRIGVQVGQKVSQSQSIGNVGSTGWATGPHLHFEFRVNGVHQDPTTVAKGAAPPVSAAARPAFDRLAQSMRTQLSAAATTLASAE
ncbi:M23 family metallopeptidase [uncultured Ramlibacter sp.]|uniref:M23 family metallopeptidase n=1 Tax=uncultured Ramlibacter sp. TaxID=260755 RepID=UPI00260D75A9|nr:M23 family metallopeptidase [uncultured Ramlibacter sp.]